MKQTAVEFYNSKIKLFESWVETKQISWKEYHKKKDNLINQAKEMEKEQINDACYEGYYQEGMYDTRAYYDKKYKKKII